MSISVGDSRRKGRPPWVQAPIRPSGSVSPSSRAGAFGFWTLLIKGDGAFPIKGHLGRWGRESARHGAAHLHPNPLPLGCALALALLPLVLAPLRPASAPRPLPPPAALIPPARHRPPHLARATIPLPPRPLPFLFYFLFLLEPGTLVFIFFWPILVRSVRILLSTWRATLAKSLGQSVVQGNADAGALALRVPVWSRVSAHGSAVVMGKATFAARDNLRAAARGKGQPANRHSRYRSRNWQVHLLRLARGRTARALKAAAPLGLRYNTSRALPRRGTSEARLRVHLPRGNRGRCRRPCVSAAGAEVEAPPFVPP